MIGARSKSGVLVFRCNLDDATQHTVSWAQEVVDALNTAKIPVYDYAGSAASPRNFTKAINQYDPAAVFIFDHGCECDVWGEEEGELVPILGVHNAGLSMGRIIAVVACSSAAKLGRVCVRDYECLAYSGYNIEYGFYSLPAYLDGFKSCAIEVFLRLALGDTIWEAHQSAKRVYSSYIDAWKTSSPDRFAPLAIAALEQNMDHLILRVSPGARGSTL